MIRTTRHTLVRAALTALVGALVALVPASVASAHSVLISISPKDGATVTTPPTRVVLTFNEDVNQQFDLVRVVDGSGADATEGAPAVSGSVVTQALRSGLGPGTYTVTFKVVSSDGHPISQRSTFTVADPAATASVPASATPLVTPTTSPTDSPTATTSAPPAAAADSAASSGGSPVGRWALGGGVVLIALAAGAWALRRSNGSG